VRKVIRGAVLAVSLGAVLVGLGQGVYRYFEARRPWVAPVAEAPHFTPSAMAIWGKTIEGGPVAPDGTTVAVDLPVSQREKNVGGSDGAGLCVFTSIEFAARWQHVYQLEDFQKWMRSHPGGGYPEKVDKMIQEKCREANMPIPHYLQYEGRSPALIKKALGTHRLPCITYDGHDCHYNMTIAHMVCSPLWNDRYAVILDNNFIGPNQLVWETPAEGEQRWQGNDGGWVVVLLGNPPPPPPHN
jgi:hypothetical protein